LTHNSRKRPAGLEGDPRDAWMRTKRRTADGRRKSGDRRRGQRARVALPVSRPRSPVYWSSSVGRP